MKEIPQIRTLWGGKRATARKNRMEPHAARPRRVFAPRPLVMPIHNGRRPFSPIVPESHHLLAHLPRGLFLILGANAIRSNYPLAEASRRSSLLTGSVLGILADVVVTVVVVVVVVAVVVIAFIVIAERIRRTLVISAYTPPPASAATCWYPSSPSIGPLPVWAVRSPGSSL